MTPQPSFSIMSNRGKVSKEWNENEAPHMLTAAWEVCSPPDLPLKDQLNLDEKMFLVEFAKYIEDSMASPISATEPETVLNDILMTARHRYSLLSKETSLSPGHVAILTLLHLLKNLFAPDNMKYQSLESFLEVYPEFENRPSAEQEKLFFSANWMHILFQITTAKKNKGLVMTVIPKLVEGNGVLYVTGSGQTQPTRDRVTLYEREGNVQPIKRLHRKSKKEIMEMTRNSGSKSKKTTKKKPTYVKKKSLGDGTYRGNVQQKTILIKGKSTRAKGIVHETHSSTTLLESPSHHDDYETSIDIKYEESEDYSGYVDLEDEEESVLRSNLQHFMHPKNSYLSLPPPIFTLAPPIPVCRSQSSFSKAAAYISSNQTGAANAPVSYLKSPKERYLDIESNGMKKTSSANWGAALYASREVHVNEDQLQMFRETSEDSDLSGESTQCFPPHLFHQTSGSILDFQNCNADGNSMGSPNVQPRNLERIHSTSLESNDGEVDIELLEKEFHNSETSAAPEPVWLCRSTSASSVTEGLHVNG
jgi:hypothetical protein